MRTTLVGLVTAVGLITAAAAAQAAPTAPAAGLDGAASQIIEIAGGCGPGFHPSGWRDRWGYWHRRCVPNGGYYGRPYRHYW